MRARTLASLLAAAAPFSLTLAAEPLASGRSGAVKVGSDRKLEITGLSGDLTVRRGTRGEIRFEGRDDVALTREPGRLVLSGTQRTVLNIAVGPEMSVAVEANGSTIRLRDLGGAARVAGSGLTVDARSLKGGLDVVLERSKLGALALTGDIRLDGREIEGRVVALKGQLDATIHGGKLDVTTARGVALDTDGVALTLTNVRGPLRGRASGGSIVLRKGVEEGDLRLSGVSATIQEIEGDLEISTDRDVEFRNCTASLHIDSLGGSVRGTRNDGLLEIRASSAEVKLSALSGPMRIQGSDLRVGLENVVGALYLDVTSSTVGIVRAVGDVDIDIEQGDVDIQNQTGRVGVESKGGSVRVRDARGSVDIAADGQSVEVAWVALSPEIEGYVGNASGGATVRLPERASCRLEAKSSAGRVRSEIGGVQIAADGTSADGPLAEGGRPLIRVEAAGDVAILGPEPKPEGRR